MYTGLRQNYRGSNTNSHIHTNWHSIVSVHVSFSNAPEEQNIQLSYKPNGWTLSNTNFKSVPIFPPPPPKKTHFVSIANTGLPYIEIITVYSEHLTKHKTTVWVNARVSETGAMYSTHCDLTAKKSQLHSTVFFENVFFVKLCLNPFRRVIAGDCFVVPGSVTPTFCRNPDTHHFHPSYMQLERTLKWLAISVTNIRIGSCATPTKIQRADTTWNGATSDTDGIHIHLFNSHTDPIMYGLAASSAGWMTSDLFIAHYKGSLRNNLEHIWFPSKKHWHFKRTRLT